MPPEIANEDDDPAFLRAVSVPRRGIGQTTLAKLAEVAAALETGAEATTAAAGNPYLGKAVLAAGAADETARVLLNAPFVATAAAE